MTTPSKLIKTKKNNIYFENLYIAMIFFGGTFTVTFSTDPPLLLTKTKKTSRVNCSLCDL